MPVGKASNWREKRFIAEYAATANGTQSAIKAGYARLSAKSVASWLLTKHHVLKQIADKQKAACDHLGMDLQYLLASARETLERCLQAVPVLDRDGNETGQWKFDARGAVKAIEVLAKLMGLYQDKKVYNTLVNVNMSATVREALSDATLRGAIAAISRRDENSTPPLLPGPPSDSGQQRDMEAG